MLAFEKARNKKLNFRGCLLKYFPLNQQNPHPALDTSAVTVWADC